MGTVSVVGPPAETVSPPVTPLLGTLLQRNNLTGEIPAELGGLVNLGILFLDGNELTGCIPPALRRARAHDLGTLGLAYCEP